MITYLPMYTQKFSVEEKLETDYFWRLELGMWCQEEDIIL